MKWNPKGLLWPCICTMVFATGAMVKPAAAQDGNIRSVTFYTVKPDRVGDFEAEIKVYDALLLKAGSTHYGSTWSSLTGSHEFAHVIYYSEWADVDSTAASDMKTTDQAADLARANARINDCTEHWRRIVEEILPEYNINSGNIPKMIRVLQTQVRPEKYHEYLELMKHEIFPAVQKAGTKDYSVAEARLGESNMQITSVTGFDSWTDLDTGIGAQKGLSKEDYQALLDKVRSLATESEYDVYRFEPDLSYLPPPPTAK
jgi:hypothetical protein